ncbi:MAG TPA: hypothetical protein VHC22_21905 [Pirellulales bacterium]|nr:hypothetical protein [Pirellulales bacterium]
MDTTQFIQFARDYWWVPLCPAAAVTLLTPLMRVIVSAGAIGLIVWALLNHKKIAKKKGEPVIIDAEVVEA